METSPFRSQGFPLGWYLPPRWGALPGAPRERAADVSQTRAAVYPVHAGRAITATDRRFRRPVRAATYPAQGAALGTGGPIDTEA